MSMRCLNLQSLLECGAQSKLRGLVTCFEKEKEASNQAGNFWVRAIRQTKLRKGWRCFCNYIYKFSPFRAVFKWPIESDWLKNLAPVFQPMRCESKPTAPCTHDFSRALSKLQVIASNSDWFIALFALVVIGWNDFFGLGVLTVIWKQLYQNNLFSVNPLFLNQLRSSFPMLLQARVVPNFCERQTSEQNTQEHKRFKGHARRAPKIRLPPRRVSFESRTSSYFFSVACL